MPVINSICRFSNIPTFNHLERRWGQKSHNVNRAADDKLLINKFKLIPLSCKLTIEVYMSVFANKISITPNFCNLHFLVT